MFFIETFDFRQYPKAMDPRWHLVTLALGLTIPLNAQGMLNIPATLGTVVRTSEALEAHVPDYILIQDVHSHGEAQVHIAALLQLAQDQWGVQKTFIEGAFTKVEKHDLPAALLDEKSWPALAESGELSGSELALLQAPASFDVIGIDDRALYRENVLTYERLQQWREKILREGRPLSGTERELLDNLLSLRMTPGEYARYQKEKKHLRAARDWAPAIHLAEYFYAVADARSAAFLTNASAVKTTGPRVLVTGGFHTEAMCEELQKSGKSFVVIRPRITRPADKQLYKSHLEETARMLGPATLLASKPL